MKRAASMATDVAVSIGTRKVKEKVSPPRRSASSARCASPSIADAIATCCALACVPLKPGRAAISAKPLKSAPISIASKNQAPFVAARAAAAAALGAGAGIFTADRKAARRALLSGPTVAIILPSSTASLSSKSDRKADIDEAGDAARTGLAVLWATPPRFSSLARERCPQKTSSSRSST